MSYLRKLAGSRIRALREMMGWSQSDIADILDVEPASVSRWESGQNLPEPEKLEALAQRAGLTATFFYRDDIPIKLPDPTPEQAIGVLTEVVRSLKKAQRQKSVSALSFRGRIDALLDRLEPEDLARFSRVIERYTRRLGIEVPLNGPNLAKKV